MLTGQNGILTQAQKAGEQTDIGREKEAIALAYNGAKAENNGGDVDADDLDRNFGYNDTKADATDVGDGTITVKFEESQRTYTIDANGNISDPTTGTTPPPPVTGATDGSWSDEKEVNTPVIKENMELVKWDGTQFVPDETNSSYSYDEINKQWANAVVTIDGVESYFVWIPRYEYKITYYTDENKTTTSETPTAYGTIDINFIPTSQTTPTEEGYIIHPAFTNDVENGGWDSELPGIWVGKYETSLVKESDKTDFSPESPTTIDANTYAITIQPGKSSWRNATIDNQYTMAKSYSTSLNSHMLKNSEWGAVAYLTESKYGRNGTEVDMNNKNYITAMGDIVANKLQSSTGNETGIYDLRGGATERVAAYLQGGSTSNGNSLVSETNKKFVTVYTGTNESTDYKLGDATYETKNWHRDDAYFVYSSNPFFSRGGHYNVNAFLAGVFYHRISDGSAGSSYSLRMCLAVK